MYMKLMDFSTQRARLLFESEMTFLQEFGYAIFDCVVFTVISGASSGRFRRSAAFFMSTREENFLSAYGSHYRQVCIMQSIFSVATRREPREGHSISLAAAVG